MPFIKNRKEERKMNRITRKEFWKEFWKRLKAFPLWVKITFPLAGIALIVMGITSKSPELISIPILLTGIALLVEAPIILFVELKKEYTKKKTK